MRKKAKQAASDDEDFRPGSDKPVRAASAGVAAATGAAGGRVRRTTSATQAAARQAAKEGGRSRPTNNQLL